MADYTTELSEADIDFQKNSAQIFSEKTKDILQIIQKTGLCKNPNKK